MPSLAADLRVSEAEALEAAGDLAGAFAAYAELLADIADPSALAARMGRLALALGDAPLAEKLLTLHVEKAAPEPAAVADLARAQTVQGAFERAQATLTQALTIDPSQAVLWLALGELLAHQARHPESVVFLEEALRLDPCSSPAQTALAEALWLSGGDADRAIALSGEAPAAVRSRRLLAAGRLAEGWASFAAELEPGAAQGLRTRVAAPIWRPGSPAEGRVLVFGEAELADELLLAHVISAVMAGTPLILAINPRWRRLAERSFPGVLTVARLSRVQAGRTEQAADLQSPHVHEGALVSGWTTLRALAAAYRPRMADFGAPAAYLVPDPARVQRWRGWLAGLGLGSKIGLQTRPETTADCGLPAEVLRTAVAQPGVTVVALDPAQTPGEAAWLREAWGVDIHQPDLDHGDLEDLAALVAALDGVVGPVSSVTHLAAACGARTWLLTPPRPWQALGQPTLPWFPRARLLAAGPGPEWSAALEALVADLRPLAGFHEQR